MGKGLIEEVKGVVVIRLMMSISQYLNIVTN